MSDPVEVTLKPDEVIPGQEYCLVSFVSPENVLKNKDVFFFQEFVNQFEVSFKTKILEEFLASRVNSINTALETHAAEFEKLDLSGVAQTCRNSKLRVDETLNALQDFSKKNLSELSYDKMKDNYDTFMYNNSKRLENDFYVKNDFTTTVRSLKIRGSYSSQEEASHFAKKLQKKDPYFNIYCVKVGQWLPWDPQPSEIKDQVYQEEELNTLMKKYRENEDAREEFHRETRNRNKNQNIAGSSSTHDTLFNGTGDLAIQRKIESASKQ